MMFGLTKKEALALRGEELRIAFGLPSNALSYLRKARGLISDPDHWTRYQLARDAKGEPTSPEDESATCWCAQGAIYCATGGWNRDADGLVNLLTVVAQDDGCATIWTMNDRARRGHERVLACFDRAIAMVK